MPVHGDTILCESIRQEVNNKVSLLGVFGQLILVPAIPSTMPLALFQRWVPGPNEPAGTTFQFGFYGSDPNGDEVMRVPPQQAIVGAGRAPQMLFVVQIYGFPFRAEGEYRIVTEINGRPEHTHVFEVAIPTSDERARFSLTF